MALQKQNLPINFSQGLDTKTDDKQIPPGKFLSLVNSVFTKAGLLSKRNGYGSLASLPDTTYSYTTTFNGNLTAVGSSLAAYSKGSKTWVNKGDIQPVRLSVLPLIRSNTNQSQVDSVSSSNGFICTVFTDQVPVNGVITDTYKYVVADSTTGQNIVAPTLITGTAGTVSGPARVFVLNRFFIMVFSVNISGTYHLQYRAITIQNPSSVSAAVDISATYTPSPTVAFDGVVANNNLYLAWNGNDGGGAIRVGYIDSTLVIHSPRVYATEVGTMFSVTADTSGSTATIWVTYYNSGTTNTRALAVTPSLVEVTAPTTVLAATAIAQLTSVVKSMILNIFYEIPNNYSYQTTATNYIRTNTITRAAVVTASTVFLRSVGLASKAFTVEGKFYMVGIYYSDFQPTYFLLDQYGQMIAKVAYSNGGTYVTTTLPSATVVGSEATVAYFFKDFVASVNKSVGVTNNAGIYAQTGLNKVTFNITTEAMVSSEIGNNLHLSGGFLWMYDGYEPVEHGFQVYPDYVKATGTADLVYTGTTTNGSPTVTALSSTVNLKVGMTVVGTGIPANTTIVSFTGSTMVISHNATASNVATSLTFGGALTAQDYYYYATYEWSDNQGNIHRSAPSLPADATASAGHTFNIINIPTLRLTYKTANPVKIVLYRGSVAQAIEYQVTSIILPILNDTTIDSVSFIDIASDSDIVGNNLLYTTGNVVENIAAPSATVMTLFKSRLLLVDSEDENLLWYSKQVIENTPVEMSDLFTIYTAPTTSAQASTGGTKALAAMDDKAILWKKNAIYYITGTGPDNTGANNDFSDPVFITSTVGCENQASVVFIPQGLMFQSDKGIWLLGRDLNTSYIGAPVEGLTQGALVQSAVNVPGTTQVRFTLDTGITLMYDYYYGQWGSFSNVPAISSTLYEDLHTFIDSFGRVFQETIGEYLDGSIPVTMQFTTGWMNLAGVQGFERAYFFYLLGTYKSAHKLCLTVGFDYNPNPSETHTISPDNNTPAWGGEQFWGGGDSYGGPGNLEQWRVFFQRQKCEAFQISLQESFDPSYNTKAGAGLTISGLNLVIGSKSGSAKLRASRSVG